MHARVTFVTVFALAAVTGLTCWIEVPDEAFVTDWVRFNTPK